jgi:hydrogenase nickel incorporation protein HypA/HybF
MLKQTEIELENEKAVLKCRVCGHQWAFSDVMKELSEEDSESIHFVPDIAHVYIRCPKCNSPDFEIVEGRGVWIEYIEGE